MSLSLRYFFRNVIVGEDQFILSHTQYKRILLTGQLCFITVIICLGYTFLDLYNGRPDAWPFQLGCAGLAFASFILNRKQYFRTAKFLLGITVNCTVFLFAISEPIEKGIYIYFITASLGAFVAFGYEERRTAILFVLLSTILAVLSMFLQISIVDPMPYSTDYIRMHVLVNFLGSGGASVCILYFLASINHRWEAALNKNEKTLKEKNIELTNLNSNLDRFVYSTSHDLRSPLKSLRGLINLTRLSTEQANVKDLLAEMTARVDHLEKFISDIAEYSRNRSQAVVQSPVEVKKLLNEVLDSIRYFPGAAEMLVKIEVDENLVVVIDSIRLEIILSNLLSNAIKYRDTSKERSLVMIRMEFINDSLIITVEDNGIGIPKEFLNRIFDMYVRAHEHSQGSGLGLYIMKETVEKLGGKIHVESEVSGGTSFKVTLPAMRGISDNTQALESLPA